MIIKSVPQYQMSGKEIENGLTWVFLITFKEDLRISLHKFLLLIINQFFSQKKMVIERLTIKSQVKKWYFLIKVQKRILDIFWTQLEFYEPWKLHDKKSIYVGAQKRSIELEKVKML